MSPQEKFTAISEALRKALEKHNIDVLDPEVAYSLGSLYVAACMLQNMDPMDLTKRLIVPRKQH